MPQTNKYSGIRSCDLGGQAIGSARPTQRPVIKEQSHLYFGSYIIGHVTLVKSLWNTLYIYLHFVIEWEAIGLKKNDRKKNQIVQYVGMVASCYQISRNDI
jgi:hypothetical protein